MKPGQFFSHTTALAVYGPSMPEEFENETEVHVAAVLPEDRARGLVLAHIAAHRRDLVRRTRRALQRS